MRRFAAWVIYFVGERPAGTWLFCLSDRVQGPSADGPWNAVEANDGWRD